MKTPTKKPSKINITVALPSGKTVTIKNCSVTWKWNASAKEFVPAHTVETARKIDAVRKNLL